MEKNGITDSELSEIFEMFFGEQPEEYKVKETSRRENDFRETVTLRMPSGERYVLKLADNDFTSAGRVRMWKRCAKEYRKLGCRCPDIICAANGSFPTVEYKGQRCVAWAEEYAKFPSAEEFFGENHSGRGYREQALLFTARVAAKYFDFTEYPSGYCLFERFSPGDKNDEVMENALEWKKKAAALPDKLQPQAGRIWQRWIWNRDELDKLYRKLPTSVFQADLNPSNILVDENGRFAGLIDFNLCGRDVFLNYLFREIWWIGGKEEELAYIRKTLKEVSAVYRFSELEKKAAPLLYKCLKPLWRPKMPEDTGDEIAARACLDDIEKMQAAGDDLGNYMD